MATLTAFVLAAAALLATPGPTNTLLAASGAVRGIAASLPLLAAELLGYLVSINALGALIGPLLAHAPGAATALHVAVSLYLLFVAWSLWKAPAEEFAAAYPVTWAKVFVTTLLNPKAAVFAFGLAPAGTFASVAGAAAWLPVLAPMIVAAGFLWIAIGAMARRGLSAPARVWYRAGAVAMVAFALVFAGRATEVALHVTPAIVLAFA
ncbi:MAG: hypothetical protein U1E46_18335 [Hyphomicrobiales bacterium]